MEKTLHRDGLPAKLLSFVGDGNQLTVKDTANRFNTSTWMIRSALNSLRKNGHSYVQIVGGEPGVGKKNKAGKIVDVRKKEKWALEAKEKQTQDAMARLTMKFKYAESLFLVFPTLRPQIEEMADELQRKLIDHRAQLRISNGYGNQTNSDK